MNGQQFKMKVDRLWNNLMANVDQINRGGNDMISRAEEILMETDAAIRQLKVVFRQYQFTDWSEEIYFFKNTKPQFVAVYIYYSKILSIEASKPFSDTMVLGPTMKMKEVIFYIFMVSRRNLSITTEGNRLFWIKNISSVSNLTLSSS